MLVMYNFESSALIIPFILKANLVEKVSNTAKERDEDIEFHQGEKFGNFLEF